MKKKNLIINRGPQFEGVFSKTAGFFMIIFLIMIVYLQVKEDKDSSDFWINTFIALPMFLISLSLFLGIEGVEFDLHNRKVRKYRKYGWIRIGIWKNLNDYQFIGLDVDRETRTNSQSTRVNYNKLFDVYLEGANQEEILIDEFLDYHEGKKAMLNYAQQLGLLTMDNFEEEIISAKARRRR